MKKVRYRAWYRTGFKCAGIILQGAFAGIFLLCLMNFFYWTEGSLSLGEMGKSFEQTEAFFNQVEETVRRKLDYDRNIELFELNGQFDELQEVDIRQYETGALDEANLNLNTTYYIRDLLMFYQDGLSKMEDRIQRLTDSGLTEQQISEQLDEEAQELERVFPISGNSLADFVRISGGSSSLLKYYQQLCSVSQDVGERYQQYEFSQENPGGEENSQAPSNVAYYVENTATKQRYTNMSVKSLSAARRMVQNSSDLIFLFEGERQFNIMVANSEYVLNEEAAQRFMNIRFLGAGEKILLAVNTSYLIGDKLQEAYRAFSQREPVILGSLITGIISIVLLIVLLILSVTTTGRRQEGGELVLNWFDRIPTEIAAGLCLIAAISWYLLVLTSRRIHFRTAALNSLCLTGALVVEYWIFLFSLLGLCRRIKGQTLWSNSVLYVTLLVGGQVYQARQRSRRLAVSYLFFFALNIFFVSLFHGAGVLMAIVLDMAVMLYMMRDEVGKQSVREGLYQISQGRLDYKVDTSLLTGDSLEMGEAVNEMGDGLQNAVDAIIKNERLKAELITNVSHDIKTPLTSIINYVDLLKREDLQNERAKEYIRVLEQKSQRLKQLTEDLIEASKINSGNIELHRMPLQLQQILQQAYGEFAERLEESRLEPVITLEKEPLMANVDGRQLWRVFENLLSNIAKYAMPGTRVYMELKKVEELAEISFRNVSRQKLAVGAEELQERFVRGDLSRSTEGSGLGLSIAKSLTELMDGSFEVYLEGDFFQVTLFFPIYKENGANI